MTPGSNLLRRALRVVKPSDVEYKAFTGRAPNAAGIQVSTYATAIKIKGSVQPVPRTMYQALGLDFSREYFNLYSTQLLEGVTRDRAGDQFTFAGELFEVLSATNWKAIDGWNGVLAIKVTT